MSEDALVNTSAGEWPSPDSAYFAVRRMQTKLHRWAGEDLSRRFGLTNGQDTWRARYAETHTPGVRREALRCIPGAAGRNSEGGSWIA